MATFSILGINHRSTLGYVTDGTDEVHEGVPSGSQNYTALRGYGWETTSSSYQSRDRDNGIDRRLAGVTFDTTGGVIVVDYRIDLAATGAYNIRCAIGDAGGARTDQKLEIFDDATSLGVLFSGVSPSAGSFVDATGTTYTAANWPGSNTAVQLTFSSTICRFRLGDDTNLVTVAHLSIAAAAASSATLTAGKLTSGGILTHGRLAR